MAQHSSCWAKARVEEAAVKREAVEAAVDRSRAQVLSKVERQHVGEDPQHCGFQSLDRIRHLGNH